MSLSPAKYEIIKPLGGGAFGEVLLVRHKHLSRLEAAKIIRTGSVHEALNEAKTIQELQHENIVQIYDADVLPAKDGIFITMEYQPRGSVGRIKFVGRKQLVDIATHVLRALEHAHGKGFLHRDIKANNILLSKKEKAILTDFGLSAKINDLGSAPPQWYRFHKAPEVIAGKDTDNYRTDLYSLGVTMHRIVNGDPSWIKTISPAGLNMKILAGEYPDRTSYRPDISMNITKIINKALSVDPLKRYQSARSMLAEIERKAIFRFDWTRLANAWHATPDGLNVIIEEIRRGKFNDIITSKKRIESSQYRKINKYCFYNKSIEETQDLIRNIMAGIDSGIVS